MFRVTTFKEVLGLSKDETLGLMNVFKITNIRPNRPKQKPRNLEYNYCARSLY